MLRQMLLSSFLVLLVASGHAFAGFTKSVMAISVQTPDGESMAEIGPEGGTVLYRVIAQAGGVGVAGMADLIFNIRTDFGIEQQPLLSLGEEFEEIYFDAGPGVVDGDDILLIGGHQPPDDPTFGLGLVPTVPLIVGFLINIF